MKSHEQLNLFTENLFSAYLVAHHSPRQAFYRIWVENTLGDIKIIKESGIKGRVLDRRSWPAVSIEAAEEMFYKRIKSKTNPERKSPRKYTLVHCTNRKQICDHADAVDQQPALNHRAYALQHHF